MSADKNDNELAYKLRCQFELIDIGQDTAERIQDSFLQREGYYFITNDRYNDRYAEWAELAENWLCNEFG